MEEQILKIKRWASHGTPTQFVNEMQGVANQLGYELAMNGNTLSIYKESKEGGFLGLGGHTVREEVLQIIWGDGEVDVPADKVNAEFLKALSTTLQAH
jgi:hypothetical protein